MELKTIIETHNLDALCRKVTSFATYQQFRDYAKAVLTDDAQHDALEKMLQELDTRK